MTQEYIKTRSFFEVKSMEKEGVFSGYASIFNHVDHQGDKVIKGAFKNSLIRQQKEGKWPKMLWQHDPKEPIGMWTYLEEDEKGLYVEGQILLDLQKGREAYALMKKGVLDGLSIGCQVKKASHCEESHARLLNEIELMEISLVTFAANDKAKVLSVKSHDILPLNQKTKELENALKNALNFLKKIS